MLKNIIKLIALLLILFVSCAPEPQKAGDGSQPTTVYLAIPRVDTNVDVLDIELRPTSTVTAKMAPGTKPVARVATVRPASKI
jgi:hypothetical protein